MNGKFIQEIRAVLGLSQFELGEVVRLEENTIAKIEGGSRNPTPMLFELLECKYPKQYKLVMDLWKKGEKNGKAKNHKNRRR